MNLFFVRLSVVNEIIFLLFDFNTVAVVTDNSQNLKYITYIESVACFKYCC